MSGGVDSSVAAYLLKKQGYDVIGVTMQIWQEEDQCSLEENGGCCGLSAVEDARRVAEKLEITEIDGNLIAKWKGKTDGGAVLLMSHQDVVPEGDNWVHQPFSGEISDGAVWGRGTMDTKCSACCFLQAAEELLAEIRDLLKNK